MRKLPFVIAPKAEPIKETVGNEEIGVLELPRINDLSPSDRLYIRQASKDLPNLQREAVRIAKSIKAQRPVKHARTQLTEVVEFGEVTTIELTPQSTEPQTPVEMGLHEIYQALIASDADTLGEFLAEILDYQDVLQRLIDERPLVMATAMLRRIESEWTMEDTMQLGSKLISELNQFALKEENGWEEKPAVTAEPLTDEKLGE